MVKKLAIATTIVTLLILIFLYQFRQFRQTTICIVSTTATLENPTESGQLATAMKNLPAGCKEDNTLLLALAPLISTELFRLTEQNEKAKEQLKKAIKTIGFKTTIIPLAQTTAGAKRLQQFYKELDLLPIASNVQPFADPIKTVLQNLTISIQAVVADEKAKYLPHSDDITLTPAIESLGTTISVDSDFNITLLTGNIEKTLSAQSMEIRDLLLALVQNRENSMIIFDRDSLTLNQKLLGKFTLYHKQNSPQLTVTLVTLVQKEKGKTIPLFHPTTVIDLSKFTANSEVASAIKHIEKQGKESRAKLISIERDASFTSWEKGETEIERVLHDSLRKTLSKKEKSILTLIKTTKNDISFVKGSSVTHRKIEILYPESDYPLLVHISPQVLQEILQMTTSNSRFSLSPIRYHYQNSQHKLPRSITKKMVSIVMPSSLYIDISQKMDTFPSPEKIYPKKVKEYLIETLQEKNPYRFYPRWKIREKKSNG